MFNLSDYKIIFNSCALYSHSVINGFTDQWFTGLNVIAVFLTKKFKMILSEDRALLIIYLTSTKKMFFKLNNPMTSTLKQANLLK